MRRSWDMIDQRFPKITNVTTAEVGDLVTRLQSYQRLLASGTALREGLERIVSGRTGALIAIGSTPEVEALCVGGFLLDATFTPTALRELSKMDGGVVVTADLSRIVRAGVHFAPDPSIPTDETGTRHASADRLGKQTGVPVVTVSASMSTIALYLDGRRHVVERPEVLIARSNQAFEALARYHVRLRDVTSALSALEVSDQVTVRDVATVAQSLELVRRLAAEVGGYVTLLGADGRLLDLQLHEATGGSDLLGELLQHDYGSDAVLDLSAVANLADDELIDPATVAAALGFDSPAKRLTPRGLRQLSSINGLPDGLAPRLLDHFGGLQGVLAASFTELTEVDGIDDVVARAVRDGLVRLTEAAYRLD